jgi:hypothetical protein
MLERFVTLTIDLDEDELQQIDDFAASRNMSRDEYMVAAAKGSLTGSTAGERIADVERRMANLEAYYGLCPN